MNHCKLQNQSDIPTSLDEYKGKKIVLFFYPKDNTPGCTLEAKEFSEKKELFHNAGVVVIGISKDSVKSHQNFIKKQELSVTLLSDPEQKLIDHYGVWQEKMNYGKKYMGIVRTTIILDENGDIEKRWDNVRVNGHVEDVLNYITKKD